MGWVFPGQSAATRAHACISPYRQGVSVIHVRQVPEICQGIGSIRGGSRRRVLAFVNIARVFAGPLTFPHPARQWENGVESLRTARYRVDRSHILVSDIASLRTAAP